LPGPTLIILAVLLTKHFVFDFVAQSDWQLQHKDRYGHPGGIVHAAAHAGGSVAAVLLARPALEVGLIVLIGEAAFHYHVDWAKARILRRTAWSATDNPFWVLLGADQLLHGLTYVVMTAVLLARA
jgi:hypothetical protein